MSRESILKTVRANLRRRAPANAAALPIPALARTQGEARLMQFIAKAEAVSASLKRLSSPEAIPAAAASYLRSRNLPTTLRMGEDTRLSPLDWAAAGLEVHKGAALRSDTASLSHAFAGIAETGTLCLLSGPANPVTLTFVPPTHLVAVQVEDVLAGYEDLWSRLRDANRSPRTVNLVTGPSRSADIEQTLTLGAHGPGALHILLIE